MKKLFLIVLACALTVVFFTISAEKGFCETKYSVYCASGKIEVDSRDLSQMKSARGSNTCLLKAFDYKTDAESYARTVGGVGSSCKCRITLSKSYSTYSGGTP